jgi:tRNA-dihydrouridine synthase B
MINRQFLCGLAFTEMISVSALAHKSANTMPRIATAEHDKPLGIQILGKDEELIRRSLDVIAGYDFDVIDFNAACPVKKVASKGKGAGLLREPETFQKLLKLIVENTNLPVTVKIRTGWDEDSVNAVDIALRAQDAGVSALFIHGRTRQQRYAGTVDYNVIEKVKEAIDVPVIASGDALSPELIRDMFNKTGCDGVVVARGALGNPWILRETAEFLEKGTIPARPDMHELTRVMKEHLAANVSFYGEKVGVIQFRKFFGWYAKGMPIKDLRGRAFCTGTMDVMMGLIDEVQNSSPAERFLV